MKKAYIFRGPCASGKSTVVTEFAESLKAKAVRFDHDVFRWGFHLTGRNLKDVTEEEHRLAFRNLLVLIEEYCKDGGYTVIVDGLFTWDNPEATQGNVKAIIEILERYGFSYKSFVLTADKQVLDERNRTRNGPDGYVVPQDEVDQLYAGVMNKIGPEELVIDSTHQSPEETLEVIKQATK